MAPSRPGALEGEGPLQATSLHLFSHLSLGLDLRQKSRACHCVGKLLEVHAGTMATLGWRFGGAHSTFSQEPPQAEAGCPGVRGSRGVVRTAVSAQVASRPQ